MSSFASGPPPDQTERVRALNHERSILVQAPAGSGKTDLLTRRFLRLLAEVEDPGQIVAITFTKAAAAEMRHRILSELEKAAERDASVQSHDEFSMEALARRALEHSRELKWQLPDLHAQLRISTIDSFCRELALQQPLLSGVGGAMPIDEQPTRLYRRAARQTLEMIDSNDPAIIAAIETLLLWRDNNWHDLEDLLVKMLEQRDRWMHDFVFQGDQNWEHLRERLERPFARAVERALTHLSSLLRQVPVACDEVLQLAQFACKESDGTRHQELAEIAELPYGPFANIDALEDARRIYLCLAKFLLTEDGAFRDSVSKADGFPAHRKVEKQQMRALLQHFKSIPGPEAALAAIRGLPPVRYTEEDWKIVRASFTLLRRAAAELRTVLADAGTIDFVEVAQAAQRVLRDDERLPSEAALTFADRIHHLLVDEFQDTSRRQHQLVSSLVAAWDNTAGRTVFVVGDPMQSIYSFRDADAELFAQVRDQGLEVSESEQLFLDLAKLSANFRTEPTLVDDVNEDFANIFEHDDGSGIAFSKTVPAREATPGINARLQIHVGFEPRVRPVQSSDPGALLAKQEIAEQREASRVAQIEEIVGLIRSHSERVERARAAGKKYRIAILGRTKRALEPVSQALREGGIPFRAVDLENLKDRPEILDALSLARAVQNPYDRVAWLGVLRAPWSGLSLEELHAIAADTADIKPATPIPQLLSERLTMLSPNSRVAAERVLSAFTAFPNMRATLPTASPGTLLQALWLALGGESCVDATARANLELLWKLMDKLPEGEQDLLSPALDAALGALCSLPDPAASSECGVQLMTIHKSKGLEFEVVIVPELQARPGRSERRLLSWLERGLTVPDDDEITEFLVAPLSSKGADRGQTKMWVDRTLREREAQETRRILYVAATRARNELHLYTRLEFKSNGDGEKTLAGPSNSLLATAWPAVEEEMRARFEEWKSARSVSDSGHGQDQGHIVTAIAASKTGNLFYMQKPLKPTVLRRLPVGFQSLVATSLPPLSLNAPIGAGQPDAYERHEGGLLSRALGSAVHKLLEELARLRTTLDWSAARAALLELRPRTIALIRSTGVAPSQAAAIAAQALDYAIKASEDPQGQWILSPHSGAESEAAWAGVHADNLRLVRVDRVFRAGSAPLVAGDNTWWIIDFKTAHTESLDAARAIPEFRAAFAPQLQMYAEVLRNLHGADASLRAGLYYPRMALLDWWEIE